MKYKLTFALAAFMTSTAFAAFQAPLPEFKNEKQLAEWRAEKADEATSHGYVAEETAFYTGKPYLTSSSNYAFKYRSYSPELSRWTSEDPSGFPDGSNNLLYVSNQCLSYYDPDGLAKMSSYDGTLTWYNGVARPLSVAETFNDYYRDVTYSPADFSGFSAAFSGASNGTTISLLRNHDFGIAYAVGRVNFSLDGTVTVNSSGQKVFSGDVTMQDDTFDFNSNPWGSRSVAAELLTRYLASTFFNPALGGEAFDLTFVGSKSVTYE